MAAATVVRRYPDERIQRLHRSERPARVVGVSPAIRHAAPDQPIRVPPPPRLWGYAYCRWQSRGRCGPHLPRVRRLRMGSLLPGYCSAKSRGWLLVPHHRSLHICPSLKSAAASPAQGGPRVDDDEVPPGDRNFVAGDDHEARLAIAGGVVAHERLEVLGAGTALRDRCRARRAGAADRELGAGPRTGRQGDGEPADVFPRATDWRRRKYCRGGLASGTCYRGTSPAAEQRPECLRISLFSLRGVKVSLRGVEWHFP